MRDLRDLGRDLGPRLPGMGRRAILAWLSGDGYGTVKPEGPASGVFVTLRAAGGALRGCMGTDFSERDLVSETVRCAACLAATRGSAVRRRFEPSSSVRCRSEVSVLEPEEPVHGTAQLESARTGSSCGMRPDTRACCCRGSRAWRASRNRLHKRATRGGSHPRLRSRWAAFACRSGPKAGAYWRPGPYRVTGQRHERNSRAE